MTDSFSPEIIGQEIELAELHSITGGVLPLAPMIVLAGIGAALGYVTKKALDELDTVPQNVESNKLSYGGLEQKEEDPFGGAFTGKAN